MRVWVATDSPGTWGLVRESVSVPVEGVEVAPRRHKDLRAVLQDPGPPPDLLIADLTGPFDDGLATSAQGRALLSRQPSIVLCNQAHQDTMRNLVFSGVIADFYPMGGPMEPAYLQVEVWRALRQAADRAGRRPAAGAPETRGDKAFAGRRALVIDDDLPSLTLATDYLEVAGFEVHAAGTVAAACLHHRAREFDVILLDLFMPGVSGARAIRMVREHFTPEGLPIIVTSAYSDVSLVRACIKEGISAYLVKPIRKNVLMEKLDGLLPK